MKRQIEVWLDETSDADDPTWCVSLCESDGDEIKCLSTHDDQSDALEAGEAAARNRSLGVFIRDKHGSLTPV